MCLCKSVLEYQQDPVTLHVSPTSPFSPPLSAEKKPINKHCERLCRKLHTTLPSTPFSWQFSEWLYLKQKPYSKTLLSHTGKNFMPILSRAQSASIYSVLCRSQRWLVVSEPRLPTVIAAIWDYWKVKISACLLKPTAMWGDPELI